MLTIEDFKRADWNDVEEIDEQVFLVRGALTSDQCSELVAELQGYTEEQWSQEYIDGMREYALRRYGRTVEELIKDDVLSIDQGWVNKNIIMKSKQAVTQELNKTVATLLERFPHLSFRGVGSAQRQYEGVELKLHTDGDSDPIVVYAVIFYLNDDYTAGELYFPTRSLEVKPAAGSAIIFPTTSAYRHGVHHVGPGPTRYVLPSFIIKNSEG